MWPIVLSCVTCHTPLFWSFAHLPAYCQSSLLQMISWVYCGTWVLPIANIVMGLPYGGSCNESPRLQIVSWGFPIANSLMSPPYCKWNHESSLLQIVSFQGPSLLQHLPPLALLWFHPANMGFVCAMQTHSKSSRPHPNCFTPHLAAVHSCRNVLQLCSKI